MVLCERELTAAADFGRSTDHRMHPMALGLMLGLLPNSGAF